MMMTVTATRMAGATTGRRWILSMTSLSSTLQETRQITTNCYSMPRGQVAASHQPYYPCRGVNTTTAATVAGGLRKFFSTQRTFDNDEETTTDLQRRRQQQLAIEWEQRCQLAVSYRIAYLHDWHMNVFNHITLKVHNSDHEPNGPYFFLNNFGYGFDEITASSLLKVDLNGNIVSDGDGDEDDDDRTRSSSSIYATKKGYQPGEQPLQEQQQEEQRVFQPGYVIHSAVHYARPDVHAVWHCHHVDTTAVCQTKIGLLKNLSQESALAYHRGISYHPFEGTANDIEERPRLAKSLGPTNAILLLENHGPLIASPNLYHAFAGMFMITRACTYQIQALSSVGGDISKLHSATTPTTTSAAAGSDESASAADNAGEAASSQDELIKQRIEKFHYAPQPGKKYDTDRIMFEYAARHAEKVFG